MKKMLAAFLRKKSKPDPVQRVGFGQEERRSGRITAAFRRWSKAIPATTTAAAVVMCLSPLIFAAGTYHPPPAGGALFTKEGLDRVRTELTFIYAPAAPSYFVSAYVEKLTGNQNKLTITVTELYPDGTEKDITETFMINNNATDTYQVGGYRVFVDVKGNIQIRQAEIVGTP